MTDSTMTDEELRRNAAEADARAQALAHEIAERRRAVEDAERARVTQRDHRLIRAHKGIDESLDRSGRIAYEKFSAAAQSGDLIGAYSGFLEWMSSRQARNHIRVEVENANARNPIVGISVLPNLREAALSFTESMQAELERAAARQGIDLADQLLAQFPEAE